MSQTDFGIERSSSRQEIKKPRLLLHACCAPCSSAVVERLAADYAITIYFYNPNIHQQDEYLNAVMNYSAGVGML